MDKSLLDELVGSINEAQIIAEGRQTVAALCAGGTRRQDPENGPTAARLMQGHFERDLEAAT